MSEGLFALARVLKMAAGPVQDRNQGLSLVSTVTAFCKHCIPLDATIYVGGLDDKVGETLLWELFLQAGPVGEFVPLTSCHGDFVFVVFS